MRKIFVLFAVCSLISYCKTCLSNQELNVKDIQIIPYSFSQKAFLGQGYFSAQEKLGTQCIEYKIKQHPSTSSSLILQSALSESELMNNLGFSGSGKAKWGLTQVSAAANFAMNAKSQSTSLSFIYAYHDQQPSEMIDVSTVKVSRNNFAQSCGDQVVYQIEKGSSLYILFKLDFNSSEAKSEFIASMGGSYSSLASMTAEMQKSASNFAKSTSINIQAFQKGGFPEKLAQVIAGLDIKKEEDKIAALLHCSIAEFNNCQTFLSSLLRYATSKDDDAFPAQALNRPSDLAYLTKPWSVIPNVPSPPSVEMGKIISSSRRGIEEKMDNYLAIDGILIELTKPGMVLPEESNKKIDAIKIKMNTNKSIISNAVLACWDELDLSNQASSQKCVDASKLEGFVDIDGIDLGQPVPNIAGDWTGVSSEPFVIFQNGKNITGRHYNDTYTHDIQGNFIGPKQVGVITYRLHKPTNCTTVMKSNWEIVDDKTIKTNIIGTDGKCDLGADYNKVAVINKIFLTDLNGKWRAPTTSPYLLKKVGANVTGENDNDTYNHQVEALFTSATELGVRIRRLHKPSACVSVLYGSWHIANQNEIVYSVYGTDGKCGMSQSYQEAGSLFRLTD